MAVVDIDLSKVGQTTIVIPERMNVEDVDVRLAPPSGTIVTGDKVIIQVIVKDSSNVDKFNETVKVRIKDVPPTGQEVLAVGRLSFNTSPIPV